MLYHHDNRDYETAAREAAIVANRKLQTIIAQGQTSAQKTYEAIFGRNIQDALVRGDAPIYSFEGSRLTMKFAGHDRALPVTSHAFGQVLDRAGIKVPGHFARKLLTHANPAIKALLPEMIETLNRGDRETSEEKSLVRVLNGEVRAVLSARYKRINSSPYLGAFALAGRDAGMVPVMGCASEVKDHFRMLLPAIFEPMPNEPMCFGLEWSNSDYGAGHHTVKLFILRLWCTNTGVMESLLKQVHLGKTIDSLDFETQEVLSERTRQLTADAASSAMQDIFRSWISPERVHSYVEVIRNASATEVHPERALSEMVRKGQITSVEREKALDLANVKDVHVLPPVRGDFECDAYRFSNVFSFMAQQTDNDVRARELEVIAGTILANVPANRGESLLALPADAGASN
jgi:hypothetical protein